MAKNLTVYDYGLFFGIFNLIASFIPIKDFGLAITVVRFIPEYNIKNEKEKIKNALIFLFFFQLIVYFGLCVFAVIFFKPLVSGLFNDSRTFTLFLILLSSYVFSIFDSLFNATYLGFKKVYYYSIFQLVSSVIILLSCYLFGFFNMSLELISIGYFIAFFLTTLIKYPFFIKLVPGIFKHRFIFDKIQFKDLFSFSFFQFTSASLKNFSNSISTILMAAMSTIENVAYLNIAMPTANIIKFLFKPISVVLLPISSELSALKDKSAKNLLPYIYKYMLLLFIPIGLFFLYFSKEVIFYLFGDKYLEAGNSLGLFVFAFFFISLFEMNSSILLGYNKRKESLISSAFFFLSNLILNLVFIKNYGLIGAAIGHSLSAVLSVMLTLRFLSTCGIIIGNFIESFKTIIIGFLLFVCSYLLAESIDRVFLFIILFIAYVLTVLLLKLTSIQEIKSLIRRSK